MMSVGLYSLHSSEHVFKLFQGKKNTNLENSRTDELSCQSHEIQPGSY